MSFLSPRHTHAHLPERRKLLKKGFSFLGMKTAAWPRASKASPADGKPVATAPRLSPSHLAASPQNHPLLADAPEPPFPNGGVPPITRHRCFQAIDESPCPHRLSPLRPPTGRRTRTHSDAELLVGVIIVLTNDPWCATRPQSFWSEM